jgi:transposase InsO family protein
MGLNIISVEKLCKSGYKVIFDNEICMISDKSNQIIAKARKQYGLYQLEVRVTAQNEQVLAIANRRDDLCLWHNRLAHVNEKLVRQMIRRQDLEKERLNCTSCIQGKMARSEFSRSNSKSSRRYELVHTDVCGPFEENAIGEYRYFVTFIDDYSKYCFVYLIRQKSEVFTKFKELYNEAENSGLKISILRSDNGGEYTSKEFDKFLKEKGVTHQFSIPYLPQQNGVAERMNRTLQDAVRSMIVGAQLSKTYWGYAVRCAAYVRNRCMTQRNNTMSPLEILKKVESNWKDFRIFGCICYAHVPKEKRSKLDVRAEKCIFLGYSEVSKGYIVQEVDSGRSLVARDVKFFEDQFINKLMEEQDKEPLKSKRVRFVLDDQVDRDTQIVTRSVTNQVQSSEAQSSAETPWEETSINREISYTGDSIDSPIEESMENNENDEVASNEQVMPGEQAVTTETEVQGNGPDKSKYYDWIPFDVPPVKDHFGPPQFSKRRSHYRRTGTEDDEFSERLLLVSNEPETYKQAMESKDSDKWLAAMKSEMQSMKTNHTWDLVKLPTGRKLVDCRWTFKIKPNEAGGACRYKARLCARGFTQIYGIDFDETFSPVVKFTSIRVFLVKAISMKMVIHQMDVVTAFLNAPLEEEIFMKQAPGFEVPGKEQLVCKLNKSLYGLKQSSRQWNKVIDVFLKELSFTVIDADTCVYTKHSGNKMVMISLYVDDLLIASNDKNLLMGVKKSLNKRFEMKDLGRVQICLGLEFDWQHNGSCVLNQNKYIERILERFNMVDCKPVDCPIASGQKLTKAMCPSPGEEPEMKEVPYRSAVGSLIYLVTGTRPDIAVATGEVAKFCENPGRQHWAAVKRILRYLRGTMDVGLLFNPRDVSLTGFCDADWAGDLDNRRSTTGYLFMIGGVPVSWKSKRQQTVALSTAEAEYMALSDASREATWLRRILLNFDCEQSIPTIIFDDNQGCIALAKNPVEHERTKHIDIRHHFIREMVESQVIDVQYVCSEEMLADLLTKGVSRDRHVKLCKLMNLVRKSSNPLNLSEGGVLGMSTVTQTQRKLKEKLCLDKSDIN